MLALAYVCACLFGFIDGSFGVFAELDEVKASGVKNEVFFFYSSVGQALISFLCTFLIQYNSIVFPNDGSEFVFSQYGFISGVVSGTAAWGAYIAFDFLGLSIGAANFYGLCTLSSALFSVFVLEDYPSSLGLYVVGIFTLLTGTTLMCFCKDISHYVRHCYKIYHRLSEHETDYFLSSVENASVTSTVLNIVTTKQLPQQIPSSSSSSQSIRFTRSFLGLMASLYSGIACGLAFVPYEYAPSGETGFVYIVNMGIGAIATSPIILLIHSLVNKSYPNMILNHPRVILWGICSGILIGLSDIVCLISLTELPYGVSLPFFCLGIFVSGLWGIFFLKEISDYLTITLFFLIAIILLVGTVMISIP
jgi:glucose uptake protein GlcU